MRLLVLSVARDKDIPGMVRTLQDVDAVVLTQMHNARAASIDDLQAAFTAEAPSVNVYAASEIDTAMQLARGLAHKSDIICATGSLYLAAEALRWAATHGAASVASEIEGIDH